MSVNRIDATLTDDQRDQANAARAALPDVLPFLIAIDRADRPKFGDKNRPIDVKPLASPRRIPTCCRAVSTSRFRTDAQRAETLYRALCAPVPAGGVMNKAGAIHPEHGTTDVRHGPIHAGDGATDF
jgi:hypothetical protein